MPRGIFDREKRFLQTALLLLLPLLCMPGSNIKAEDRVSSRLNLYVDDDSTTIISPMLILQKDVFEETSLNLQYIADIQSCASVDVVSTASPSRGYEETRHNVSVGFQHRINLTKIGLGYAYSTENDYTSNAILANISQELFQRNSTVALGVNYRRDEIGRVNDEHFSQHLNGLGMNVSLTQLLSPKLIAQVVYFLEYLDGYQASPYRFVPVADFSVPETHPKRRIRQSFTGRIKESLTETWSAEQSFRFYIDTWGLTGETVLLQLYWQPVDPLTMRFRYRFHNQNKADFYQEFYDSLREFVSRDRELGTLRSHLLGPQIQYKMEGLWVFEEAIFDAKVEYFYIDYRDYALLQNKEGLLIGTGFNLLY